MMSQHSNSLATATAAILVHNENLLRLHQNGRHFHGKRMHANTLKKWRDHSHRSSKACAETTWKFSYAPIIGNKKLLKEVVDTLRSTRGSQRVRLQEEELKAGERQIRNTMSKESRLI